MYAIESVDKVLFLLQKRKKKKKYKKLENKIVLK